MAIRAHSCHCALVFAKDTDQQYAASSQVHLIMPSSGSELSCGAQFGYLLGWVLAGPFEADLGCISPNSVYTDGVLTVLVKVPWMVSQSIRGCRGAYSIVIYSTW